MNINVTNARRLIKRLEDVNNPVAFDMGHWFVHNDLGIDDAADICRIAEEHSCGTAACLAGHAALLAWQSGDVEKTVYSRIPDTAAKWLGLSYGHSRCLFQGDWNDRALSGDMGDLTVEQAIAELNRLIELEDV